jgi:hypothetical protein
LEDLKGLSWENLPKFTKLEYAIGTHIRGLKFHLNNGTFSKKPGSFGHDKSVSLEGKDIGKIERRVGSDGKIGFLRLLERGTNVEIVKISGSCEQTG